ncbi:hypothetical protein [Nocardia cyriacigeorgica]|uniref:hypothetical protein n=1 Tax=Nocardia cyriacigeorgica TaxID=135487 RepID=UPI0013D75954|nr:hypothetical protein [Nocardia cyriacigeorgica]NEW27263.1 hypothetical protein [Nocardia cyriacigeorgica]
MTYQPHGGDRFALESHYEDDAPDPRPLWRAWDREWRQIGQWHEQPSPSELAEDGALTVDQPNGRRRTWLVIGGKLVDERELVAAGFKALGEYFLAASGPDDVDAGWNRLKQRLDERAPVSIEEFIEARLAEDEADPARVLRQCAVIHWLMGEVAHFYNHTGEPDSTWALMHRRVAAIWSDHPDYQQEWANTTS